MKLATLALSTTITQALGHRPWSEHARACAGEAQGKTARSVETPEDVPADVVLPPPDGR
jgi:hypothetical protein